MCTNPILVRTRNIENTPTIKRNLYYVPCGICIECKKRKQKDYEIRGIKEYERIENAMIFITLTYNETNLPRTKIAKIPCFNKKDIIDYTKRVRENVINLIARKENQTKKEIRKNLNIKYIVTSEYGERRKRPHYHAIISIPKKSYMYDFIEIIQKNWGKGFTKLGKNYGIVNSTNGIKYVTKYITKSSGEEEHMRHIEDKYKQMMNEETDKEKIKEIQSEWENYQGKFFLISKGYGEYEPNKSEWENNAIRVGEKKYTIPNYYKYKYLYANTKLDNGKWQRRIKQKGIDIFEKRYEDTIKQYIPILNQCKEFDKLTKEDIEYILIGQFHKVKDIKKYKQQRDIFNQEIKRTSIKQIEMFDKLINSNDMKLEEKDMTDYTDYIVLRNEYLRKFRENKQIKETIKEYNMKRREFNLMKDKEYRLHETAEVEQKKVYEQWGSVH